MSTKVRGRQSAAKEKLDMDNRAPPGYFAWSPSVYTVMKALLSARLCAAIWSNISDCDETYNYWEPMHYLMYGYGFQTWEYSPRYAIRSYAYLWCHILPLQLYTGLLQVHKILQFYFLRCFLAFVCSLCEVYFYKAVCKQFGVNVGRLLICFLLFSTGMFISSAAFLPSTFAMYGTLLAVASWYLDSTPAAIFGIAVATIIGWPFAAALGIPIAYDYVIRRQWMWTFLKWALISALICLVPLVIIDSYYFGEIVIAPLNIILYNVFSDHGPDIYGVEPWSFYFINGFLNFNVVFPLALISLPLATMVQFGLRQRRKGLPIWLCLGPMYIWLLIFMTRPHKEERFLFPIYPMICLSAAVAIDYLQKLYAALFSPRGARHYTEGSGWLAGVICAVFSLVAVSRIMALYYGYHAPLEVYSEFNRIAADPKIHTLSPDNHVNVCVGKEWYRFPNNFFLPDEKWHLQFIRSDFRGQLPKPYSSSADATRENPSHMNDMNKEETSRYLNITRCHYLVDVDIPVETPREPRYSLNTKEWKVVASAKFIDAPRSHKFFRAFYIPFLTPKYCSYVDYNILKTTRHRRPIIK